MKKLIGGLLVASPFVGIFAFATYQGGIWEAIGLFAAVVVIVGIVFLGCNLLYND